MKFSVSIDMDDYTEYASLVAAASSGDAVSLYFDAVPRFLDLFERHGTRATFFMIGRDSRSAEHRRVIREIAERGHEVGNHSWSHPYNFRSLPRDRKIAEIEQADAAIADITGERPSGFRAPSGGLDAEVLHLLAERGYAYDSSIIPTWMMWAFMLYGVLFVRHSDYELGSPRAALAPTRAYRPSGRQIFRPARAGERGAPDIVELPCSVVPGLRVGFYGTFFRMLPPRWFEWAVRAHGRSQPLVMLMHLIDFAQISDALQEGLRRTPGVGVSFERRERFVTHALETLSKQAEGVPLRELARDFARPEPA